MGLNQWVPAKYVVSGYNKSTSNNSVATVAQSSAQPQSTVSSNTQTQAVSANSSSSNAYNSASSAANTTSSYTATTTSTSSYTSTATGSEADAKAWIANKESSGSYTAQNGQYYGKYQLSISYLNGDLSASNQEKVADNYVYSRYGSWTAAKAFWLANGWY